MLAPIAEVGAKSRPNYTKNTLTHYFSGSTYSKSFPYPTHSDVFSNRLQKPPFKPKRSNVEEITRNPETLPNLSK